MRHALPPLAFLDWGIGGFGVVRELAARHPHASYTYLSDSGFVPYGKLSRDALVARLEHLFRALAARGVRRLVVACNAASTAVPRAKVEGPLRVTDIVGAGARLVLATNVDEVGLVGGVRTVRSRAHATLLRGRVVVRARIAQPLSAFVEAGEIDGARVTAAVARVVAPLRGVRALLLACTHYPALAPLFRAALPGTKLLDPAALALREALAREAPSDGARVVLTTGDPGATRDAARLAFGITVANVEKVALDFGR